MIIDGIGIGIEKKNGTEQNWIERNLIGIEKHLLELNKTISNELELKHSFMQRPVYLSFGWVKSVVDG